MRGFNHATAPTVALDRSDENRNRALGPSIVDVEGEILLVGRVGIGVAGGISGFFVVVIELDEDVAAVWKTILGEDNEWLAERIETFDVTEASVREVVASMPKTCRDRGFKTILKNRTFHGGILAAGSAPEKFGENGKGIKSRWYADTIARRIREIATVSKKIELICGDGIQVIREHSSQTRAAWCWA